MWKVIVCVLSLGTLLPIHVFSQSLEAIREEAAAGGLEAQNMLGEIYEQGEGFHLSDNALLKLSSEISSQTILEELNQLKGKKYPTRDSFLKAIEGLIGVTETNLFKERILKHVERDVARDYEEAVFWFRVAAEAELASAQANLAKMYFHGRGVPQSNELAFKWATRSAEQGYDKGLFLLGWMYRQGLGTPANNRKAAELYFEAADQGLVSAQNNLGAMYEGGLGVERDTVQALEWYKVAFKGGSQSASDNIQRLQRHHQRIEELMALMGMADTEPALLIPLFDKHFDQDGIRDLLSFYETELGIAYSKLQQEILNPE